MLLEPRFYSSHTPTIRNPPRRTVYTIMSEQAPELIKRSSHKGKEAVSKACNLRCSGDDPCSACTRKGIESRDHHQLNSSQQDTNVAAQSLAPEEHGGVMFQPTLNASTSDEGLSNYTHQQSSGLALLATALGEVGVGLTSTANTRPSSPRPNQESIGVAHLPNKVQDSLLAAYADFHHRATATIVGQHPPTPR